MSHVHAVGVPASLKSMFGADADVGFPRAGLSAAGAAGKAGASSPRTSPCSSRMGADIELLDGERLAPVSMAGDGWDRGRRLRPTGEGWFDPPSLAGLFRKAAQQRGVTMLYDDVTAIEAGARVEAVGWPSGAASRAARSSMRPVPGRRSWRRWRAASAGRAAQALRLRHRQPRGVRRAALAPLTVDPSGVWFRPKARVFLCGQITRGE